MKIFVTGGAGFIGSAVIRHIIKHTQHHVINIDCLTYAGNLDSLRDVERDPRYIFEKVNICDQKNLNQLFASHKPNAVMHLAAESHVDRSIHKPASFMQTNIFGTYSLLEASKLFWNQLSNTDKENFRFHHISTDEVYGDLANSDDLFTEESSYEPSSPYSASKASADHLVRAWHRTFKLPVIISNCSNNYGPYQFPEKLIPLTIINALKGKALPIYGNGMQIRDWLFVEDHAKALYKILTTGRLGETYNIGSRNEKTNLEVVKTICSLLDDLNAKKPYNHKSHDSLIKFVPDRPGHDLRYAIDPSKIENELGWRSEETFESGLRKTVEWYLENELWYTSLLDSTFPDNSVK